MQIDDLFEYPLPSIKTDIEKIVINTSGLSEGFINIKNTGGGTLSGEIFSNSESISFQEKEFLGNNVNIRYEIDTSSFSPGDRIISKIIIISTGGEKNIPVVINIMPKPFVTDDKTEIFSIKEFYSYAKINTIDARRILGSDDFMLWLKLSGFEHMSVLEEIVSDSNKERALDNFFVLSGIKKKSSIVLEKSVFEYKIKNNQSNVIKEAVNIKKSGIGYINAPVYKKFNKPWLRVFCDRLVSKDFDNNLNAVIYFEIDSNLVKNDIDSDEIIIEADEKISVKVRVLKLAPIRVWIERHYYNFDDNGKVFIENYSGQNLVFEIKSNESFIRFDGEKYFVNEKAAIPFRIKLADFTKNVVLPLQNKPFVEGKINIKTNFGTKVFNFCEKIISGHEFTN